MARKIMIAVGVALALLAVVIGSRPATFEVKRSLLINAPAEVVYAQVADFKAWAAWSPWDRLDPTMKRTYSGAESGVGAHYAWTGTGDVGEGSMTITDARPSEHLGLDLEFLKPFPAKNRTDFSFEKTGAGTTVTWAMSGQNNFMAKAMSLVMNMDKMIGPDFEQGLASMKSASESAAAAAAGKKAADEAAAAAPVPDAGDAGTP